MQSTEGYSMGKPEILIRAPSSDYLEHGPFYRI